MYGDYIITVSHGDIITDTVAAAAFDVSKKDLKGESESLQVFAVLSETMFFEYIKSLFANVMFNSAGIFFGNFFTYTKAY